jgi:hypothetical protein
MDFVHEKLDDAEWLQARVNEGCMARDIAHEIGVSMARVRDHLYRLDIEYPKPLGDGDFPELRDKRYVINLLRDNGSVRGAAKAVGTSTTTIDRWCTRHGIDKTKYLQYYEGVVGKTTGNEASRHYGDLATDPKYEVNAAWRDPDTLWQAYWGYFWSADEIGRWVGVSGTSIRNEMERHGIPTRNGSAAQRIRHLREHGADSERIAQEIDIPAKPMYSNGDDIEREEIETDVEGFGTLVAGD